MLWLSNAPRDTARLIFYAPERMPVTIADFGAPNENMEIDLGDITLSKGVTVRGRVLSPDGTLAGKAPITFSCPERSFPSLTPNTPGEPYQLNILSNEVGEYVVSGIFPGILNIKVDSRPFAWSVDLENPILEKNIMAELGQDLVLDLQFKE